MKRLIYDQLLAWKDHSQRKPLLLEGVRQCGKTYILKKFGAENYQDVAYFNFEGNQTLQKIFETDLDPNRIIQELAIIHKKAILPKTTLLIFDEIQFSNAAVTSLKYFYENRPDYHLVCAGSLLGVALSKPLSFPVGKVDFLTMRPLNSTKWLVRWVRLRLRGR